VETKVLGLIALAVVVSGCSQLPTGGGGGGTSEPQQLSGKGLEVTEFRVSDKTLSPGQTINVYLTLKNFHREEIDLGNITLRNLALLESSTDSGGPCSSDEIGTAKQGIAPVIECRWRVTAPEEDLVGGFSQRPSSITANIPYDSVIKNYQPMKVKFLPLSEVNRTSKKAMSFSNGEVGVNMEVETPVVLGQNKTIDLSVSKRGSGIIDSNYTFDYTPSTVFVEEGDYPGDNDFECPSEDKPILRSSLDFSCYIQADGAGEVNRNLFMTIRYKYVKAPSTTVTIVNDQ
jgi:hypothetical protein